MCVKRFNQSLWVKDTYLEFPARVRWCREEILSVEQMGLEGAVVRGWGVEAGLARQIPPSPVTLLHQHLTLELNILPGGDWLAGVIAGGRCVPGGDTGIAWCSW